MFQKIFKIIFLSGKSYLLFIFIATLLSLFSYILSSNIAYSVNDYLKSQIQPLLGGDIVFSSDSDVIDTSSLQDFTIAKTIETNTTLFDGEKNPYLIELVYHNENYPIYDTFSYDVINSSGSLIVSKEIYDTFGNDIEIFEKPYQVYGVITKTPLGNLSVFSNFEKIYLPLSFF